MKHVNLSVPGGQGLDGTGLVEMKRTELKKVEGGGWNEVAVGVAYGSMLLAPFTGGGSLAIGAGLLAFGGFVLSAYLAER